MLSRTDDHRRAPETDLLRALEARDPLALAEAYHRTINAAYAVARRILGSSGEVEALLVAVYAELWSQPPGEAPLEGWVRQRCFALGVERARAAGREIASPSTALLVEGATPSPRADGAEAILVRLDDDARRAVLLAHDRGLASDRQGQAGAAEGLTRALLALAEADGPGVTARASEDVADWLLGLLPAERAAAVRDRAAADPDCAALVRVLRRGRRRIEGLPPTPDTGNRVLVRVLASAPAVGESSGEAGADVGAAAPQAADSPAVEVGPESLDELPAVGYPLPGHAALPSAGYQSALDELYTEPLAVEEVPRPSGSLYESSESPADAVVADTTTADAVVADTSAVRAQDEEGAEGPDDLWSQAWESDEAVVAQDEPESDPEPAARPRYAQPPAAEKKTGNRVARALARIMAVLALLALGVAIGLVVVQYVRF